MKTNRRQFICGAVGLVILPTGCAIAPSVRAERRDDMVVALLSDWPTDADVVLARPRDGAPVVLVRDGDEVRALSSVCTHQGCIVRPSDGELACPCHGSTFALDGTVQRGPADEDLPEFPVQIEGDEIRIRAKRAYE